MDEIIIFSFLGIFCILGICLIGCFYMLFRNNWVYKRRVELINEVSNFIEPLIKENPPSLNVQNPWTSLDKLPSEGEMMFRFWIWDVNKFIPGGNMREYLQDNYEELEK